MDLDRTSDHLKIQGYRSLIVYAPLKFLLRARTASSSVFRTAHSSFYDDSNAFGIACKLRGIHTLNSGYAIGEVPSVVSSQIVFENISPGRQIVKEKVRCHIFGALIIAHTVVPFVLG